MARVPPRSTHRSPRVGSPQDHWQRLEVETPENVVLGYELAGFGSRLLAAMGDLAIVVAVASGLLVLVGIIGGDNPWGGTFLTLAVVTLYWGYFFYFEGYHRGQTPGKKWMGLRVVRDSGHPIGLPEAAVRNLLRVADAIPPPFLLGLGFIAFHPRAKRIGDLVAGTVVVRDRPLESVRDDHGSSVREEAGPAGVPELADAEFRILEEFVNRATTLDAVVRERFAARLVTRFADRIPRGEDGETALRDLLAAETQRRRGQFGSRSLGGTGASRFVELKEGRWAEFQSMAMAAANHGLDRFSPEELVRFTTRYREVAADYARARTYGVPPAQIVRLERAVAAGHNALYQDERSSWSRIWRFVAEECPAAVGSARRAVLIAFLAFAVPAGLGYLLLRERPEVATEVLPDVMLDRAEAGAARQRDGKGYFDAPPGYRPLIAASIIANNVQVSFYCFAGGVFLGIGSLVLLAQNGLTIGAATGHFANMGLFGYLWTFVAGHGLLELFAIWVAGAAGFQLGLAVLNPGRLTRREALVVAGRRAIRLVGFAVVLLLIAGLVEGLISASTVAPAAKLIASGVSGVFLIGYLANGARAASHDAPA
jgi:uncharacterized membrane protein SpoIIM required for sporulation/uncharacterized RDD family membrane protein YckC